MRPRHLFTRGGLVVACLAASVAWTAPARAFDGPTLHMPSSALADERFNIRLTGLAPSETVTITARMDDDLARPWSSQASFTADANGEVELAHDAPLPGGSYAGVAKMGLFYSMTIDGEDDRVDFGFSKFSADPTDITFTARVDDEVVATKEFRQLFATPPGPGTTGVTRTVIDESGVKGVLYRADRSNAGPALISITGSDGGLGLQNEARAALLASRGYTTLVLPYFNFPGLPATLREIPLEYFGNAIDWLQSQTFVDPGRIGVTGASRGGEGALLIGAHNPDVKAVVASTPSGVSWNGGTSLLDDFPSWTLGGQPIPYIDSSASRQALVDLIDDNGGTTNIVDLSAWFRDAYDAAPNKEAAEIPVENTDGGILMITGKDDKLWPANKLAKIAMKRLEESEDFEHRFTHLNYRNAGHVVLVPNLPTSYDHYLQPAPYNTYMGLGGTPAGTHRANHKAWKETLEFLEETLGD